MSFVLHIFVELLLPFFCIAIEVALIWLGEIAWWAITLGRHEPRWNCYTDEYGGAFVLLSQISLWIGAVTAAGLGLGIKFLFFSS